MRAPLILLVIATPAVAHAGGLSLELLSPRGVGRAGASMVSDDGAAAVLLDPAGLARRDAVRGQLGLVVVDDDGRYDAPGAGPVIDERGPSTAFPVVGGQGRIGPVVVGATLIDEASWSRRFAAPEPGLPVDDVERYYPHRYAGLAAAHTRRTLGLGAAWRATEWLAIGGALTLSQVELDETRRVWAGFDGRDEVGGASRDVTVRVAGEDGLVPGGVIGALIAPIDVPIEIGVSAAYSAPADLTGDATVTEANPGEPPEVVAPAPHADATLTAPVIARMGARWLGERWSVEVGAELWVYPGADPTWTIRGVTIVDDTGATAALTSLRSQVARRDHGAVRLAGDVEVVPGFVWLTGGYAWTGASTPREHLTPAAGDLGGHTAALGAEVSSDGVTVSLGVAHTFVDSVDVEVTELALDNPFDAGSMPTGLGIHDEARTTIALSVEFELR